jgi:hypothetical protein
MCGFICGPTRARRLFIEMDARKSALALSRCNQQKDRMTHELMRYGGYRYLLYKRWDFAPNGRTEEQKEHSTPE